MSQYKAQLLSILDLMPSLPDNEIKTVFPATIMINILGGSTKDAQKALIQKSVALPNAALHMYGKESKPARKIGHITLVSETMSRAEGLLAPLIDIANSMRAERRNLAPPKPTETYQGPRARTPRPRPQIAVTMGSDSDLPVLKPGLKILDQLGVSYHLTITSAHRTPTLMTSFANSAVENGFKVIIAAAGGAAHLPGMIAASTPLPVIGVPVKGSSMDGMDSLLSIVQMPRGIPVATVAINNSVNAALLAARILGASDESIRMRVEEYVTRSEAEVLEKAKTLESMGWEEYS